MAIRFVVDSASDITPAEARELGIIHVPMIVTFGETEYADGINLSHSEFYEKLIESDTLPTTSQVSPRTFGLAFQEIVSSGDTAIAITLSSKLSGTYQSACLAAQDHPGRAFVVDSENVTIGERMLVMQGLKYAAEGMTAEEIVERLEKEKHEIRLLAILDTLEYLKKGGRISAAVAFAGGLLAIKPVVAVVNGEVEMAGKARGSKNGNNLLRKMIVDCGGVDFERPYFVAYSGLSDMLLQKYIEDSADLWQTSTKALPVRTVGCTIGTHVGPGAIAVAFFQKEGK